MASTAPTNGAPAWRGNPPNTPIITRFLSAQGLLSPPPFGEHGSSYVAPPAVSTASMTATSAGGAPGAQFGPPGVGGAPVLPESIFGLSPLQLGALLIVGGFVAYKVLK